jgi:hypothetical protein
MGRIEPEALILLQDGKLCHHIVLTALTFQHGHPHHVQMPPSGFQTAAVMAVACELVGIGAATVGAPPVNRTSLATHLPWTSLGWSEFGSDFLLQKLLEYSRHPVDDDLLHLGLNRLENRSTLLSL